MFSCQHLMSVYVLQNIFLIAVKCIGTPKKSIRIRKHEKNKARLCENIIRFFAFCFLLLFAFLFLRLFVSSTHLVCSFYITPCIVLMVSFYVAGRQAPLLPAGICFVFVSLSVQCHKRCILL